MKVAEYRNEISALSDAFASLRSAATPAERVAEAQRVRHQAKCLGRAECPRASDRDRLRAALIIESSARYIAADADLSLTLDRLEVSDATMTRLAFAGEWR